MPKPFLILQLRPEAEAADDEFAAILRKGGMTETETRRIRLDQERLPDALSLDDFSGVIVGGGPGCVSDAPADKSEIEARIEADVLSLMPRVTERDFPFLGCCYGIGIMGKHLKGDVGKARYGEPVGTSDCTVTEAGRADPLLDGIPDRFEAFVGHKEALQALPEFLRASGGLACVSLPDGAPRSERLCHAVSPRGGRRRFRDPHQDLPAPGLFSARNRR